MSEHAHVGPRTRRGLSRREVLRRAAVVGGNLLWIAPAIQTLAPRAYAHNVGSPINCCCDCVTGGGSGHACTTTGPAISSQVNCQAFCDSQGENLTGRLHCGPSPFFCGTVGTNKDKCLAADHPAQ